MKKSRLSISILTLGAFSSVFAACGSKEDTVPAPAGISQTPSNPAEVPRAQATPPSDGSSSVESGALAPTFASIQKNILQPKCNTCHAGARPAHGLDFSSYGGLVHSASHPDLVVPGQPERSGLIEALRHGNMPMNADPLSEDEISAISTWIANGAAEN